MRMKKRVRILTSEKKVFEKRLNPCAASWDEKRPITLKNRFFLHFLTMLNR